MRGVMQSQAGHLADLLTCRRKSCYLGATRVSCGLKMLHAGACRGAPWNEVQERYVLEDMSAMAICSCQVCCCNALTVNWRAEQEKIYRLDMEHVHECVFFEDPRCIPQYLYEHEDESADCNYTPLISEDDPPAYLRPCMRRHPVNGWSMAVSVTCAHPSKHEVPGLLSLH